MPRLLPTDTQVSVDTLVNEIAPLEGPIFLVIESIDF